ncbi:G5 and 3D domain-containing protein [Salsuginibacillus kocurii]|uniref:G5 and 3D domain-containing protein n=1 Tax=Salsuginibacillus kocurii TaxID=427078 RepID=UPI000372957D|nr:G5 and 3D domain-containing protein [Salsuginibacillus kocurii]
MQEKATPFLSNMTKGKKLVLVSVLSLLAGAGIIYAIYETTKATVTVVTDEEEQVLATHAETVKEALAEEGLEVGEADQVEPGLEKEVEGLMVVEWDQAQEITFKKNNEKQKVVTTADDVEEVLEEKEITTRKEDVLEPSADTAIEEGMTLTYKEAFPVVINEEGEAEEILTTANQVSEVLEEKGIELNEEDRVEPGLEGELEEGSDIDVIRVETFIDKIEEEITYGTVTRPDETMAEGEEEVIDEGRVGLIEKHYEITKENGEEIDRELLTEETVQESEDRLVAVGTRPEAETVSRGGEGSAASSSPEQAGGQSMTMEATAYTANCAGCTGVTATGINLNENPNMAVVAVDPSVIPLGSTVHVEGYGEAVAGDTGGAITGNRIDLHVSSKSEANSFGRRSVEVTVLD